MFRFVAVLVADFWDLAYPILCVGCERKLLQGEKLLCARCRLSLPETGYHRTLYSDLLNKFAGRVPIAHAAAYWMFTKKGVVQKLIHEIKYKGRPESGEIVGSWYGYQLAAECPWIKEIDLLIGVPLHKSRLKKRGFNQADCLAVGIGRAIDRPIRPDVLVRDKFEASQTRKNRLQRWVNVETVFRVEKPEIIAGKHVVLIDDVLTTGATIEACAQALHRAGCRAVSVVAIATVK